MIIGKVRTDPIGFALDRADREKVSGHAASDHAADVLGAGVAKDPAREAGLRVQAGVTDKSGRAGVILTTTRPAGVVPLIGGVVMDAGPPELTIDLLEARLSDAKGVICQEGPVEERLGKTAPFAVLDTVVVDRAGLERRADSWYAARQTSRQIPENCPEAAHFSRTLNTPEGARITPLETGAICGAVPVTTSTVCALRIAARSTEA